MYSPKKNNELIKEFLSKREGLSLDFKQNLSNQKKIAKTLLAFANTEGGKIIVGVSDRGRLIGIDAEEEMFMVNEAITKYCSPPINVIFEVFEIDYWEDELLKDEKYLLIIDIPKSNLAPHYLIDGTKEPVYYRRVKDRTLPSDFPGLP
jgi:predicted HTH transcriptional regulator